MSISNSSKSCPYCDQTGAHYCVGKLAPKSCNIDYPEFDNPPHPVPMPGYQTFVPSKRMNAEEIKKFAAWLKQNEPSGKASSLLQDDSQYWELFAYRILDRLGV